jgi:S-(hydroxymethyl)glutathione dehydrogenase / alcohol dehydrogenase
MKALVYHGPMDVRVDDKPKPKIEDPDDIVLKVTEAAICGSDLHLFHGNFKSMEPGQTLGHEFARIVQQAGDKVTEVKEGDRVVIPFNRPILRSSVHESLLLIMSVAKLYWL